MEQYVIMNFKEYKNYTTNWNIIVGYMDVFKYIGKNNSSIQPIQLEIFSKSLKILQNIYGGIHVRVTQVHTLNQIV